MFGLRIAEQEQPIILDTPAEARDRAWQECRRRVDRWDGAGPFSVHCDFVTEDATRQTRPKYGEPGAWVPRNGDVAQIGPSSKVIFAGMFMVVIGMEDGVCYGYVPTLMGKGVPLGIKPEHLCHIGTAEWQCSESELVGGGATPDPLLSLTAHEQTSKTTEG